MSESVGNSLKTALSNPYVLAGGAALGILLLMMKPGNNAPATGTSANAVTTLPYSSAALQYNMAALKEETERANIQAGVAKTVVAADVTKEVALLQAINARGEQLAKVQMQRTVSNEGILKTQLTTQAAVQMDFQQNMARLGMGAQEVQKTMLTSNASVAVAKAQAGAVKNAAKWGAIGDIAGAVGNVAKAII